MLHYSIRSISEHVQKAEKYSTLSALKMKRKGKRASFVKLYLGPLFKFWNDYLFRLGFLDGFEGFCIAMISSYENFLKYAKLRELYRKDG